MKVLNGVSLNVDAGEILCVMGRNGAGKTTLLKTVMGIVRATSGSITYFWEGMPRYAQADQSSHEKLYREACGVDAAGASTSDSKDVSTYSHMFGCWETLNIIKKGMESADYKSPDDRQALIEAVEDL